MSGFILNISFIILSVNPALGGSTIIALYFSLTSFIIFSVLPHIKLILFILFIFLLILASWIASLTISTPKTLLTLFAT